LVNFLDVRHTYIPAEIMNTDITTVEGLYAYDGLFYTMERCFVFMDADMSLYAYKSKVFKEINMITSVEKLERGYS